MDSFNGSSNENDSENSSVTGESDAANDVEDTAALFEDCMRLADLFRMPFTALSPQLLRTQITDTKAALCVLEAVMKRVLTVIRTLPHFEDVPAESIPAMITEKICGLTAIMNSLNYEKEGDCLSLSLHSGEQTSQSLPGLIQAIFAELVCPYGVPPGTMESRIMSRDELENLINSERSFYVFCADNFQDMLPLGTVLLAGVYFFTPDYKFIQVDPEQMYAWQNTFLNGLRVLLKVWGPDEGSYFTRYSDMLMQLTEIKSIEFYHNMLARNVTMESQGNPEVII